MKITKLTLITAVFALLGASALMADECPGSHCSKMSEKINNSCKKDGLSGSKIYVPYKDDFCFCGCSCLGAGTEVLGSGSIDTVEEFLAGENLETLAGSVEISKVMKDHFEDTAALKIVLQTGRSLLVSPNHPFVTRDGVVKSAVSLSTNDSLLNAENEPVGIQSITPTKYTGTFYNVIMNAKSDSGSDRIILAEGVQSGDWEVQSFRDYLNANVTLREIVAKMKKDQVAK